MNGRDDDAQVQRDALIRRLLATDHPGAPTRTTTIEPRASGNRAPLSFSQERLWFLAQLAPENAAYSMPGALRLRGPLDVGALRDAFDGVVERHEILRTTFEDRDGVPFQRIRSKLALRLVDEPLNVDAGATEADRIAAILREEELRPFDLTRLPLFRVRLLRIAVDDHCLLVVMHHLITDGWSIAVLIDEVARLYNARLNGVDADLPPLPIQYADYAEWQRGGDDNATLSAHIEYWRGHLQGVAPLRLPLFGPRPAGVDWHGASRPMQISNAANAAAQELAERLRATPFMVTLGAFQVLLSRLSGQLDLTIGIPTLGRSRAELQPLVGFFESTVVLRSTWTTRTTGREVVAMVQERLAAALDHQDAPFEQVVEAVGTSRRLDTHPLFQVMFVYRNPDRPIALRDVSARRLPIERHASMFELFVYLEDHGSDGARGYITYRTDLFEPTFIDRLAEQLDQVLLAMATSPEDPVLGLPVLTPAEERALVRYNATGGPKPVGLLHEAFFERAEINPDGLAVATPDLEISYGALARAAGHVRDRLLDMGVQGGDRIAVVMPKCWEQVPGVLGILQAGGAYVPLDAGFPAERVKEIIERTDARAAVVAARHPPSFDCGCAVVEIDDLALDATPRPLRPTGIESGDVAYIIFTSGSTGKPKGVVIEHGAALNTIADINDRHGVTATDRVLAVSSMSFDLSVYDVFGLLAAGGALVIPDAEHDPERWSSLMTEHGVTVWNSVPALLGVLIDDCEVRGCGLPPSLRIALLSGDWIPTSLPDRARRLQTELEVISLGGATEASIWSIEFPIDRVDPQWLSIPYGRPLRNQQYYVLNDALMPCPTLVEGDLYIAGAGLAREYFGAEDLTAAGFITHPRNGRRLYRTGDRGRFLESGAIEFLGREDFQVKVQGYRIELGEIEARMLEVEGVREAVATVLGGRNEQRTLVGYLVPKHGATVTADAVTAHLAATLPAYMLPSAYVTLDGFPLTANGKVDRKALPEPDAPVRDAPRRSNLPSNEVEHDLLEICRLLVERADMGVKDDFFASGGDSILSIQLVSRARRAGIHITPRDVFERPTVAGLAQAAAQRSHDEADQGQSHGSAELTPIQRWFLEADPRSPSHFNQALAFEVEVLLQAGPLARALQAVADHHDALRLRFTREPDGWLASFADTNHAPCQELPFDGRILNERVQEAARTLNASLDIERGPVVRAALLRGVRGDSDRLLLVIHHLVVDGVSWRILLEDLQLAYRQALEGRDVDLPPKTTAWKSWAARLLDYATAVEVRDAVADWRRALSTPQAILPLDHQDGRDVGAVERIHESTLGEVDTEKLLTVAPEAYNCDPIDLLIAGVAATLAPMMGPGAYMDLEGHGREDLFDGADLSRTVGWFTTLYPIDVSGDNDDPGQIIQRIKERRRWAAKHAIAYGLLRFAPPDGDTSLPDVRPEVVFNYLGRLDGAVGGGGLEGQAVLRPAREDAGPVIGPDQQRRHRLAINAYVLEGKLRIRWHYSFELHDVQTVERWAGTMVTRTKELIAHCVEKSDITYSASDFDLLDLDADELGDLLV